MEHFCRIIIVNIQAIAATKRRSFLGEERERPTTGLIRIVCEDKMTTETYDLIAMGRSSIDLYSNDVGAPFAEITSFAAYLGGCPTNISVGARRLGLRAALLTAVGQAHDDERSNAGG